jgi:hypothetical protein
MKFLILLLFITTFAHSESKLIEKELNYQVKTEILKKGGFQYFYALLEQRTKNKKLTFINIHDKKAKDDPNDLAEYFLALDTKKMWDPKDKNKLAIVKLNFILPIPINKVTKENFTNINYIRNTIPGYKVIDKGDHFYVGGSWITPGFDVYLKYLAWDHPYTLLIDKISRTKMKNGLMKVTFQHQDQFERVMFFQTAKMASSMSLYQYLNEKETLVTQFIMSNVINVPSRRLIRTEMIKNIQNMVLGSRSAVLKL